MKKSLGKSLRANEIISLKSLSYIHISSGQIWLTAGGKLHDFVLSAGEVLSNVDFNSVVIQAFVDTQIQYTEQENTRADLLRQFGSP